MNNFNMNKAKYFIIYISILVFSCQVYDRKNISTTMGSIYSRLSKKDQGLFKKNLKINQSDEEFLNNIKEENLKNRLNLKYFHETEDLAKTLLANLGMQINKCNEIIHFLGTLNKKEQSLTFNELSLEKHKKNLSRLIKQFETKKLHLFDDLHTDEDEKEEAQKITLEEICKGIKEKKYKNIIVLTGAGISTAAGIPDFRSKNCVRVSNSSN